MEGMLMMENYKRMFVANGEEDRISNLPEFLIDSILERLAIQDAVRTSILSKKWRYKWTNMNVLFLDEHFSKKFAKHGAISPNGFIKIINQILIRHKGPISKFHLHIPNIFRDSFQEIDQWMLILSRNNVEKLVFINSNRRYKLPCHFFSCKDLRTLKLSRCNLKLPLQFKGFLNLEKLALEHIDFEDNSSGTTINLPQLKFLSLKYCKNVHCFNIMAKNVERLKLNTCRDAPLLRLLNSSCTALSLSLDAKVSMEFVQERRMTLTTMLSYLPKMLYFMINGPFLKFYIEENISKWLSLSRPNNVSHLGLMDFQLGDLHQLHGALCLIRNSPNLETLYMIQKKPQVIDLDVGPASNHLEAPDCLDQTLNNLKFVYLTYVEGSRPELLFMKLLLAHSPALEQLTFQLRGTFDAQKMSDIAKVITQFPRASPKAEIILEE